MTSADHGDGSFSEIRAGISSVLADFGQFRAESTGGSTLFTNGGPFAELSEQRKWADLSFLLPGPLDSPRVRELELLYPTGWRHTIRLYTPDDVDAEVASWMQRAHAHTSLRTLEELSKALDPTRFERFTATFTAPVAKVGFDLYVPLPAVLRMALGEIDHVVVRLSGIEYHAFLKTVEDIAYIPVDDVTGLDEGRSTEVQLKVRV